MSFEREAIAQPTQSTNSSLSQAPMMKEDRVVSPYNSEGSRLELVQAKVLSRQDSGQQNITEDKKAAESAIPTEESVTLSPQMAALARKEQKFRQQQQEFKQRELALEAERKEIAELKALKSKLAQKDYSDIEDLVPYDDYTNHLIEKSNRISPELQALKKLEEKLGNLEKSQADEFSKRFEHAVQQKKQEVQTFIESSEDFPLIKKAKFSEHVTQYIIDHLEDTGVELDKAQASKEVEQILKEKAQKWAQLLYEESSEVKAQEQAAQNPQLKPAIKTITNNMTTQTGDLKRPQRSFQGMSDQERYQEARRRAEEKLNKGLR